MSLPTTPCKRFWQFLLQILRPWWCAHEYVPTETIRVTMSWAFRPTRQFSTTFRCGKCGDAYRSGPYYLFGDRDIYPKCYGEDGWPVNPETGERLEMAEYD